MKIAVISDIHSNQEALNVVLNDIKKKKIDEIIFLGDLVVNGPEPSEVYQIINKIDPIVWIKGNTDNWFSEMKNDFEVKDKRDKYLYSLYQYAEQHLTSEQINYLLSLPKIKTIEFCGYQLLCVHGSHNSMTEPIGIMKSFNELKEIISEVDCDIIVCGHTHLPYISSYKGKKIINPGGIGFSLDSDPKASYGIINITDESIELSVKRVGYNIENVIKKAEENNFPYIELYKTRLMNGERPT